MRCQCVGPTIPDSLNVQLALISIKPALLSFCQLAKPVYNAGFMAPGAKLLSGYFPRYF
jgi:hypothetical protein